MWGGRRGLLPRKQVPGFPPASLADVFGHFTSCRSHSCPLWTHFPPGVDTAETQVRGSTVDTRKAGAGAQTESLSPQDSWQGEGQECLLRINILA